MHQMQQLSDSYCELAHKKENLSAPPQLYEVTIGWEVASASYRIVCFFGIVMEYELYDSNTLGSSAPERLGSRSDTHRLGGDMGTHGKLNFVTQTPTHGLPTLRQLPAPTLLIDQQTDFTHTLTCFSSEPMTCYSTFASAGSDATVSIWDHKVKKRLRQYPKYAGPVSSLAFNCDGTKLAVAVSYTWDEGEAGLKTAERPAVAIRKLGDEVKPKGWTGA
ncbi:hypothetical protein L208DRAFT_1456196 [Tricholoma matsutake]|nr:hypothetical protein L208DRAFT_1456196 [Tricholoma matsutake 945]